MKFPNQLNVSPLKEGFNLLKAYPSYLARKTWTRPISVNLLITSRCNSKCETCDSWKLADHEGELTTDDYRRLAGEIAELGAPIVTIGGGEPVLRPDLWEIIRAFKEAGRVVQLTTNALTMRADQRKKMYESGLNRVTVSLDSHIPEIYSKIRGVDTAGNVISNLTSLLSERPSTFEVDTNTVLCRDNAETFLETIDFLIGLGVPKVNFSAVTTAVENKLLLEAKDPLADIPPALVNAIVEGLLQRKRRTSAISASSVFIRGLADYFYDPKKLVFPCYAGHLTLDVLQDGSVHGCGNLPPYGNVRDASLRKSWYSKAAQQNRIEMVEGRCPNCYLSCKAEPSIAADPKRLPGFSLEKLFST
ncbi:MAG: radical SAM protein [Pseudomonadota bacterium]